MIRSTNGSRSISAPTALQTLGKQLPMMRKAMMRAASGGGALRLALVGDSTIVGFGAVTGAQDILGNSQRSIGRHMLTWLPKYLGLPARRDAFYGSGSISYSDASKPQYDSRFAQTGVGHQYDWLQSLGEGALKFTVAGDTLTFTPENSFTSIKVRSLGNVGGWGAVEVRINNVLVGTISAAVGSYYNLTTYSGAWAAGSQIKFTNLAQGSNVFDLFSVECIDSQFRGVSILEMGWSGCTISDLASSGAEWKHLPALVTQAPDLVIIKCTTNDSGSPAQSGVATPLATYKNSLTAIKTALSGICDIVFADGFPSAYSDLNPGALAGYMQAAADLGLPVIDSRKIYGETSTSAIATGLAIGPVHPGEIAYATYARSVAEMITPQFA